MRLSKESINFAIDHITSYYDSSFFPTPFEFDALKEFRKETIDFLISQDLEDFSVETSRTFAVNKPKGGYRIVHQLEPLNSLIYTALVYEIANNIEEHRIPEEKQIICSYRIKTNNNGFFNNGTGYENFTKRSIELSVKYKFVLLTDITDFYNQIYLHRLCNAISVCGDDMDEKAKVIEEFLMKINNKVSKGIPVGQSASSVLAEALMIDIDQFILENELEYVRYVDDFRIFSNSRQQLENLLRQLTEYLYDNHRLTLSSKKTEILDTTNFENVYLLDAEEIEKSKIHEKLSKFKKTIIYSEYFDTPTAEEKEITTEEKTKFRADAFKEIITEIINRDFLDQGLARHILRRSRQLRSRSILNQLLDNFSLFLPVIRDVILYLDVITNQKMVEFNLEKFKRIIKDEKIISIPYAKFWLQHYFAINSSLFIDDDIKKFTCTHSNLRSSCLYVKNSKNVTWVRQYKNKLGELNSWDRRSIMYASLSLSRDERVAWMELILSNSPNFLEQILAKYLKRR